MNISDIIQFYKKELKTLGAFRPFIYFSDIWECRIYYFEIFEQLKKRYSVSDQFVNSFERLYTLRVVVNNMVDKNVHLWSHGGDVLSCMLRVEDVDGGICIKTVATDKTSNFGTLACIVEGFYIKKYSKVFVELDNDVVRGFEHLKKIDGVELSVIDSSGQEHPCDDFETLFWTSPIDFMCSYVKISKK